MSTVKSHSDDRPSRLAWALQAAFLLGVSLLLSAHFIRWGQPGLALACPASLVMLALRRPWVPALLSLAFLAGAGLWLHTAWRLVQFRLADDGAWLRLAAILGTVAAITALAPLVFRSRTMRAHFAPPAGRAKAAPEQ
jgi:hypothetical protein